MSRTDISMGPQQLTADKLTANNAVWLKRAILNIFLLSPEPSCPNPHFVTKSLRRNHFKETVGLQSVDLARIYIYTCISITS